MWGQACDTFMTTPPPPHSITESSWLQSRHCWHGSTMLLGQLPGWLPTRGTAGNASASLQGMGWMGTMETHVLGPGQCPSAPQHPHRSPPQKHSLGPLRHTVVPTGHPSGFWHTAWARWHMAVMVGMSCHVSAGKLPRNEACWRLG